MGKKPTTKEKDLELRTRELEEENRRLRARNEELEETVLEYEYRLKIKKRPLEEITLKTYIDGLIDKSTRDNFISGGGDAAKEFLVSKAKLNGFYFRRALLFFSCLYLDIEDSDSRVTRFKCPNYGRNRKDEIEKLLRPFVGTDQTFLVESYGMGYNFVLGIVKEGKKIYFE